MSGGEEKFISALKFTFYGTWPTRFHTWFLLNSSNRYFLITRKENGSESEFLNF
jgi:hypothetical protein